MKVLLWKLTQDQCRGYDTYDSCVVAAYTEDEAKKIHPASDSWHWNNTSTWTSSPENVTAEPIGVAKPSIKAGTVICSSFNAG